MNVSINWTDAADNEGRALPIASLVFRDNAGALAAMQAAVVDDWSDAETTIREGVEQVD